MGEGITSLKKQNASNLLANRFKAKVAYRMILQMRSVPGYTIEAN